MRPGPAERGTRSSESPKLNEALASATEATWDLARSASEPAARLSRQFLDAATEPGRERAPATSAAVSVPSLDSFAPDSAAAVATIQQVGDRLADRRPTALFDRAPGLRLPARAGSSQTRRSCQPARGEGSLMELTRFDECPRRFMPATAANTRPCRRRVTSCVTSGARHWPPWAASCAQPRSEAAQVPAGSPPVERGAATGSSLMRRLS